MRKLLVVVTLALGCTPAAEQHRLDAISHLMDGDLDAAAEELTACIRERAKEEHHFLCWSHLAEIRFMQERWAESADAYDGSFEIRDRIAAEEGFGSPPLEDLTQWGWAAMKAERDDEALEIGDRAVAHGIEYGEGHLFLATVQIARAKLLERAGEAEAQAAALREAATHCETKELKYFGVGDGRKPVSWYLPTEAWCELTRVCPYDASSELREFGAQQARARGEATDWCDQHPPLGGRQR